VPSGIYFDLATWHLINTCYAPARVAEWRGMRGWFERPELHDRLMTILEERLGHELAARAEAGKIEVADGADAVIGLEMLARGLSSTLTEREAIDAIDADVDRIVDAARVAVRDAGLAPHGIDGLYFTGGSTGFRLLVQRIAAAFPEATPVRGDRFASVASGLGVEAERRFGGSGFGNPR
jgi:hypothetical chaperone protein